MNDPVSPQVQGRLFKRLALAAANAADDKKGSDILLFHIRPVSELADYMIITSANSPPQMRAIEEEVKHVMKDAGVPPRRRDGKQSEHWRVMDFGGLIVHIMHPTAREFYALEKIFDGAKLISWEPKTPGKKKKAKKVVKKKTSRRKSG
ncbi:MAG: ribosome silencing factor [Elusimicrobia bacterium]|nr:MAG: ribosome silencing factor [Elusimicrobiota bacterium]